MRFRFGTLAAVAALAVAGCGTTATQIASNPQAQKDKAAAQKILAGCGVSTTTITASEIRRFRNKAERTKLAECVVPPGHAAAFEACALNAAKGSVKITGINRAKLEAALTTCVEKNR